jgi:hypothetical protein
MRAKHVHTRPRAGVIHLDAPLLTGGNKGVAMLKHAVDIRRVHRDLGLYGFVVHVDNIDDPGIGAKDNGVVVYDASAPEFNGVVIVEVCVQSGHYM